MSLLLLLLLLLLKRPFGLPLLLLAMRLLPSLPVAVIEIFAVVIVIYNLGAVGIFVVDVFIDGVVDVIISGYII